MATTVVLPLALRDAKIKLVSCFSQSSEMRRTPAAKRSSSRRGAGIVPWGERLARKEGGGEGGFAGPTRPSQANESRVH